MVSSWGSIVISASVVNLFWVASGWETRGVVFNVVTSLTEVVSICTVTTVGIFAMIPVVITKSLCVFFITGLVWSPVVYTGDVSVSLDIVVWLPDLVSWLLVVMVWRGDVDISTTTDDVISKFHRKRRQYWNGDTASDSYNTNSCLYDINYQEI